MELKSNDQDFEMDAEQNDSSDYDSNEQTDGSEAIENVKKSTIKRGEQGICVKCNKKKKIRACSMCAACYMKDLRAKHEKEGRMTANLVTCLKCNQLKRNYSRSLCSACYKSLKYLNQIDQYPKIAKNLQRGLNGVCVQCNKTKKITCSSMCQACYKKYLKARRETGEKNCLNCKRLRQLEANGFCSRCNLNNVKSEANASDHELETNSNALDQELEANSNTLDRQLETNSNALDQKLETNSNALDQKLETNLINVKERPITYATFMIVRTDFVKHIELVGNPTTFEIEMQSQEVIDEILNTSQLKDNIDDTVLESTLACDPEDESFTTEDFISKLAQYTRSKLKPLKKKRIKLSAKKSNLNVVTKKDDHVSQSRPIQLSKKSSKASISKGPIPLIRLTKTSSKTPISKGSIAPIRLTKTASKSSPQIVKRSLKTLAIEAQAKEANQTNENLRKCSDCQQIKPHHARTLCSVCYQRFMTEKDKEETATKSSTDQTGRKQFFVKSNDTNQEGNVSQYELLFGTSRKRKLKQSDDETFSDDEFYSIF